MISMPGYSVQEKLYEGAKSIVYRGLRKNDQTRVVIKIFKKEYPSLEDIAAVEREFELTRNLNLEGCVKPYSLESYQNSPALILEDFGGTSLKNVIQGGRMELRQFLRIGIKLAETIGALHQKGIIHKDINPRNVVVNVNTGAVKLTDFGISSLLVREDTRSKNPGILEGTLPYISPEQTGRMNRPLDYRTDFYSTGVTFYEMLTGRVPFESDDPMELIHAHIAKKPVSPAVVDPSIPLTISDIVLKLLAKAAEDRYQSAFGLKADLEDCLNQLESEGRIERFTAGRKDISDRFQVPEKLYGREIEIAALQAAYERVRGGSTEMILVEGPAGIGKTTLVNSIHNPVLLSGGYFVSGKFDQFRRNTPYFSLVQAFQEMVRQLLTESEERVHEWKIELLEALGPNGQAIVDVIPEVELIIGKQTRIPDLASSEVHNRFHLVFHEFLKVFATRQHPLTIFLDDLQWADSASMRWIQLLLTDQMIPYLLLLGTYREETDQPSYSLAVLVDHVRQAGTAFQEIKLEPLSVNALNDLVSETLHCEKNECRNLSEVILAKTNGNPLFVRQFLRSLYDNKLVEFDVPGKRWRWDLDAIQNAGITDNVVEMMTQEIQRLSEPAQHVLKLAACIGNRFDLGTLTWVNEKPWKQTVNDLWEALYEGMIQPVGDTNQFLQTFILMPVEHTAAELQKVFLKFLHDRVQQAAYSLIREGIKKEIHLKIGRLMAENTVEQDVEEKIFDILNHLNAGAPLITEPKEKYQLAALNLRAGKKAKASAAYHDALKYFTFGTDYLPENAWQEHYDLAFPLFRERSECEYLCGNAEKAEELFDLLLDLAESDQDQADIYRIKMTVYINQGKAEQAIQAGKEGLKLFDFEFPESQEKLQMAIEMELGSALINLGGRTVQEILDLPILDDPTERACFELLLHLPAPLYFLGRQDILTLVALKGVNISLKFGISEHSAFPFCYFGVVLGSGTGDYAHGNEMGLLALALNEKFGTRQMTAKVNLVFGFLISFWRTHIDQSLSYLSEGFQAGLETGDLIYAGYCSSAFCDELFLKGEQLERVKNAVLKGQAFAKQTKDPNIIADTSYLHTLILHLQGRGGKDFPDPDVANLASNIRCGLYLDRLIYAYLLEDYQKALEMAVATRNASRVSTGAFMVAEQSFYDSLTLSATYRKASEQDRKEYWRILEKNEKQMKVWSDNCPENFLCRYSLMVAEMARLSGDNMKAIEMYDQAIRSAEKNRFTQVEALANELAAKFFEERDYLVIARAYMTEARYAYLRWGCSAKVQDLDARYSRLILRGSTTEATKEETTTSTMGDSEALDLATVMKASQAISGEIVLTRLMDTLMRIVLENAGAQKGFLILERNGEYLIQAQGSVDQKDVACEQLIPVDSCTNLSSSIVNYVKRTRQTVVLGDACREGIFKADPYIQENQIKSVLCMPMLKQGQLVGILYLENNLGSNTFTSNRLESLRLLSTQIATSLENAMFYDETNQLNLALKQENMERKRAEEALRESERKLRLQKKALMELAKSDAFSKGEFEVAIREITESAASTLEVERVSVWLYSEDQSRIKCMDLYEKNQNQHSRDQELLEADFPAYFQTLKEARTISADEAHSDNRTVELSKGYLSPLGINSMLDAPVRMRGKMVGVICHEHIGPARHWSLEEQNFAGSLADLIALALESSELKQAQEDLRKSEKYFRSLIENAQDMVMILDRDKLIRYVSPAIRSVLGYAPEELLNTNADDLMNPEDLQKMQKAFRLLLENSGPQKSQEFRFRHKDGTWHFVEAIAKNIIDDPDVAGIVVNFRDVTERKVAEMLLEDYSKNLEKKVVDRTQEIKHKNDELEKTLQQLKDTQAQLFIQEKMASLGNLVAGVAHEINNPIGAVNSAAAILNRCVETITNSIEKSQTMEEMRNDVKFKKSIRILRENTDITAIASDRIVKIVRILKNFARLDEAEFQKANILEGLDNTLTLLHHEMKNKVEIVKEYGEIPPLNCYPNQLNQVFMNLLANANQAIDGKGTITIKTFANGQNVTVQISDTGKGIAPENIRRIFDPGFTTKGVGVGTGLGLSISYNIIQKHHGRIEVASEVGRGTTFTITLPIEQRG